MARYSERQKAALEALMRDDIFRHAKKTIAEEGIGALTMERLATDVGVSRGTLYNYFADRDAVMDFLEERTFAPVLEAITEVRDTDLAPEEKLGRIAEWVFTAIDRDRALVMALAPNKHSGANRECHGRRRSEVQAIVEAIIREGVESASFKDLPPAMVSRVYLSAIAGMIDSMSITGEFLPPDEVVPVLTELVLGGLRLRN